MIYYSDEHITVRDLEQEDVPVFVSGEISQGWHSTDEKLLGRIKDRESGKSTALAAEYDGKPAGYVSVYFDSQWGPFGGMGYPEIVDFAVLEKYRRRGVGSRLMDTAEKIASEKCDTVYLGVGLHNGFGSAQRMYVKRGYIPDGTGAWYGDKVCTPYDTVYTNDDDLVLYLSKKLR